MEINVLIVIKKNFIIQKQNNAYFALKGFSLIQSK
jgi:hypothetical protein